MAKLGDDFPSAALLIDAGYTTHAKVAKATDEELLAIDGVGQATLEKIREASAQHEAPEVEDKPDEEAAEEVARICANPACGHKITESPCPYCGTA